jgi:hypothetical protein
MGCFVEYRGFSERVKGCFCGFSAEIVVYQSLFGVYKVCLPAKGATAINALARMRAFKMVNLNHCLDHWPSHRQNYIHLYSLLRYFYV